MSGESKKHGYFAKVLSNHIYAVLMGTVHGRCTTIEKKQILLCKPGFVFLLRLDRPLWGVWLPPFSPLSILISVSFW